MSAFAVVDIEPSDEFSPLADTMKYIAHGHPEDIQGEVRWAHGNLKGAPEDLRRFCAAIAEACDKADAAKSRHTALVAEETVA